MKLSACIVIYNGFDEALKAAQTILQYTRRYPLTLYLVDNASPDGSGEKLRAAALLYLSERELDVPARFDVAEVYTDVRHSAGKTRIAYIENAF